MGIRLGLVGAEDNLHLMLAVANEYQEFSPVPLLHHNGDDMLRILDRYENEIDIWVFSGCMTYTFVKDLNRVHKPMYYIKYTDTYLYKAIYAALYERNIFMSELSFDCMSNAELSQIFDDFGLTFSAENTTTAVVLEHITQHHESLIQSGKAKASVTCSWAVNNYLKSVGVPVYRVNISFSSIREVLNEALRAHEIALSKNKQIAVQILETDYWSAFAKNIHSSDEILNLEMQVKQKLIAYSKHIQGSLKDMNYGRYIIFSTRGELLNITRDFSVIPDSAELDALSEHLVACGIGIGQTAYEAEMYASKAVQHAKGYEKGAWIVISDDKTVVGPLGREEKIVFTANSENYNRISEKTSLSVATISKVDSVLKKIGKSEIAAQELATNLNIETRSAHRILDQLLRDGLAEAVAEESLSVRGRPRKIFRILF